MGKVLELLNGKKSYIVAVIVAGVALLTAFGVEVPDWVYGILGAFGLGFLRAGVKKSE